ncbi:MAG: PqqD family protein [bacterium]
MKLQVRISRSPHVAWREVDDAVYLVEPQEAKLHCLNSTGSSVWKLLDTEKTAEQIISRLKQEFTGDLSRVKDDVFEFLEYMREKKLIILDENET